MNRDKMAISSLNISVIVITYNPDLHKLYQTLDSIIVQRGISFEMIVCDDGSQFKFEKELREYFLSKGFENYTLILHDNNHGTVVNFLSGLEKARGKYVKVISPGDYLVDPGILSEWVRFTEKNEAEWSFSDAYYYCSDKEKKRFLRKKAHPQMLLPYKKRKMGKCIWNYVALKDNANGAAIIGKTQTVLVYCKAIMEGGILYAEDLLYFLMMFRGIVGCYYPQETICYEYGTGISTSDDAVWREQLAKDLKSIRKMMQETTDPLELQRKIIKTFSRTRKVEKLLVRGKLHHWLKWHFFPRLTRIPGKSDLSSDA